MPKFIQSIGLLLISALVQASDSKSNSVQQPNIVVIMSDDQGQWSLGSYGQKAVSTPKLDYLADQGVRLSNTLKEFRKQGWV